MVNPRARRSTFLGGAVVITAAGLFNSLMGALFRPVLTRLFAPHDGLGGTYGVGLFQIPLAYYQLVLAFTAFGINTAVSRLIAARAGRNDAAGIEAVMRASLVTTAVSGLFMGAGMFFGANYLADLSANHQAALGFRAVAPAVLIVTIAAALRGLFQGVHMMATLAWSLAIEVFVRFVFAVVAVVVFAARDVRMAAAMANGAAIAGAVAALAYLCWAARRLLPQTTLLPCNRSGTAAIYREMLLTAVPVALIGGFQPGMYLIDTAVAIRGLIVAGWSTADATAQYGQLFQAYSIINLPPVLGQALYLSLVPVLTQAWAAGNLADARDKFNEALRYVLLLGIPASAGIWFLAGPIYRLLFGSPLGSDLLSLLALSVLFLMLHSVSTALLQGIGDFRTPLFGMVCALAVKLGLTFWLTRWIGIDGAAWSTLLALLTLSTITLIASAKKIAMSVKLLGCLWRAVVSTGAMLSCIWSLRLFRIGSPAVGLTGQIVAGMVAYFLVLAIIGGITTAELARLPLTSKWKRRLSSLDQSR